MRNNNKIGLVPAMLCATAIGMALPGVAFATPAEVFMASAQQALKYCMSGKMKSGDIAYISGMSGLAQLGPDAKCAQQVPTASVKLALELTGKKVSECTLVGARQAIKLCNSGAIGEYNIDYVKGKPGTTLSGPGYGCIINQSTSGIGTALCK